MLLLLSTHGPEVAALLVQNLRLTARVTICPLRLPSRKLQPEKGKGRVPRVKCAPRVNALPV